MHKERVDDKSLCDRRDVDHTNMHSNFTSSKDHTRTKSMVAGKRSAFVKAPEVEDVDPSLHKERVNDKSLCDGRDVDRTNTCSNLALSESTCSNSVSSKDNVSKLTVDSSFNCKKSNVDVLTEVHKTASDSFPQSKGSRNKFEVLVKSMAQVFKKKIDATNREEFAAAASHRKKQCMKSSKE